jgi:hypothetical protein
MRIPNINGSAGFAGISNQAAKETTDSSKSRASSVEASQQSAADAKVEDVSETQHAGDRDAQERYDGPISKPKALVTAKAESEPVDRQAPSVFDLPVEDDMPPPQLDTQA